MPFFNREKDIRRLKAVLSGDPNLVYFVYGPINSGKTALLMKVFEELSEDYRVFYINFRWRYVTSVDDLLQVLFEVKKGEQRESIKEVVREILKEGARSLKRYKGIPIPERTFDILFGKRRIENVFGYLEEVFEELRENGRVPVFVLDEMQSIKEVLNSSGRSIIHELFNFLVGLTKERHLCHCLCATSDCLFIEEIYSNARLEGRARYILVDDLGKEEAFRVYEAFGFEEKELIWDYLGGKLGDMVALFEEKKGGATEEEGLRLLLRSEVGRLEWMLDLLEEEEKEGPPAEEVREFLKKFTDKWERPYREVKGRVLKFLIKENVLFYDPVEGTVRPQGRLIQRAIEEVVGDS